VNVRAFPVSCPRQDKSRRTVSGAEKGMDKALCPFQNFGLLHVVSDACMRLPTYYPFIQYFMHCVLNAACKIKKVQHMHIFKFQYREVYIV